VDWLWQIVDPANIGAFFSQFKAEIATTTFWVAVGKIIWINVLLSGDNALVIALACRGLQPQQRLWGMIFGAGAAVVLRIIFTGIVATLMALPYLKLVGGLALIVIAAKLLVPEDEDEDVQSASHLWAAVQIVVVADIVMSLDNVIAVAAAAKGNYLLLGLGLAVSIPIVIAGSALFLAILERFPVVVWGGGALLGWIAGGLLPEDPAVAPYVAGTTQIAFDTAYTWFGKSGHLKWEFDVEIAQAICGVLGAVIVVGVGLYLVRSHRVPEAEPVPSS